MKNGTIFTNLSSKIQEFKPNPKWLFSLCLIFSLSFSSNSLLGQPDTFTISGCSNAGANGNYTRDAVDYNGCPCYNNSNGGIMYKALTSLDWISYNASGTCGFGGSAQAIYQGYACDITVVTSFNCDPATTLSFPTPPTPSSVPTLSEWGLLILALLLMTLGTLYLVQPMMSKEKV